MSKRAMRDGITDETFWTLRSLRDYHKRLVQVREDPQREVRVDQGLCNVCFYLRRTISGQGFTEYHCRECGEAQMHENTSVPKLCRKCSKSSGRCRKCAADLDAVEREAKESP